MNDYKKHLKPLNSQLDSTLESLFEWVQINSWSENRTGLSAMLSVLHEAFTPLGGCIEEIPLAEREVFSSDGTMILKPGSSALYLSKHPDAPIHILMSGHMDTVFPHDSPFQDVTRLDANTLRGPGITDMKGGLMVMLKALELLEESPYAGKVGWEVLISPDEEIGSPGSAVHLEAIADNIDLALIFEPSFPDGSIVSSRKGSINFSLIGKGVAAHAGRDFHEGRNAITAVARFMLEAESLIDTHKGITVNIGHITGGGPVNIVPDLSTCQINVRMDHAEDLMMIKRYFYEILERLNHKHGVELKLIEHSERIPKAFDDPTEQLFLSMQQCAKDLGHELAWQPSGGVCDGNIMAGKKVPTIDALGVTGGGMHTHNEYMLLDSLTNKTRLTAYFLMKLANGEIAIPERRT